MHEKLMQVMHCTVEFDALLLLSKNTQNMHISIFYGLSLACAGALAAF